MEQHRPQQTQQTSATVPPPPLAPPAPPPVPPLAQWLRMPRPAAEPGIWRPGHVPRPPEDPDRTPTRQLAIGAVASVLGGWVLGGLLWNGYLGLYWLWPFLAVVPESWQGEMSYVVAAYAYYALALAALLALVWRAGRWREVAGRVAGWARRQGPDAAGTPAMPHRPAVPPPHADPAAWPHLRAGGAAAAADRLSGELLAGRMTDVDQARIERAWQESAGTPERVAAFVAEVRRSGAAAYPHPSAARELPGGRTAHHDLVGGQVRVGVGADSERTPHAYRGAGIALSPEVLGTSALVVGPPAVASRIVRPVTESLALLALAGRASVVSVGATAAAATDDAWDVVIRPGRSSREGLDLYGGATDPDAAAATVAEALVGDLGDSRRAAAHLALLLGPHYAAHDRYPTVRELRDLLDGVPGPLETLRSAVRQLDAHVRDLAAYERQAARDASAPLAERIALLDRAAFAGVFTPESPAADFARPLSLRALEQPLRVRVELPEHGHAEAARIIARLAVAQFTDWAAARRDQRFAALVLDDATHAVTPQTVRGLQRLRVANAGLLLGLPGLGEVPEPVRAPLLGAVGCRVACAGITPWDAAHFAEAWGHEWVERRTVTAHEVRADEPLARAFQMIRRWATGRAVTRESVTVSREQRQRWSASDLADLPAGHAVVSMTAAAGERTPPILITTEAP
ncbi:ATP-binding protein [Streptomyces malaysiensis]|uniref:ATP-binding protein n=1 Tax=Streptomyces malaysiensis TaxID=92644 RepID=UPI000BFF1DD9|nr:ATP-binding protein [Streptomyces malaysiensis]ATL80256.1 putative ATP/GTP binding membrane protein [Streptomyces malaysiensis]